MDVLTNFLQSQKAVSAYLYCILALHERKVVRKLFNIEENKYLCQTSTYDAVDKMG